MAFPTKINFITLYGNLQLICKLKRKSSIHFIIKRAYRKTNLMYNEEKIFAFLAVDVVIQYGCKVRK